MTTAAPDIWSLTLGRPQVDPDDLAAAVTRQASEAKLDYRTRLLIRDSADALRTHWGPGRWSRWLDQCPQRGTIESILGQPFEEVGFPSLQRRLMEKTRPETIRQFLTELGYAVHSPLRVYIAGSIALMLPGYLDRRTDDIDLVDEVPKPLREQYVLLEKLQQRYGLHLGHVQRHYLPAGWEDRAHSYAHLNHLQVFLVDVYDVFMSKLFSARDKDMDDLRLLLPQLDKVTIVRRLKEDCGGFLAAPRLLEIATQNWHILFGEELPS